MLVSRKKVMCIDIGASKIHLSVFFGPNIKEEVRFKTPQRKKDFFSLFQHAIFAIAKKWGVQRAAIGIAGIVDPKRGKVIKSAHLPFLNGVNFGLWVRKVFKVPALVENDARAFAIGEAIWGRGRGYKTVVGITLGTGVGGGIVIGRKLWEGGRGSAGEVGHMSIQYYPRVREWEELVGARFFGKSLERFAGISSYEKVRHIPPSLRKKFDRYAFLLALGLVNIVNFFNPDIIVLGGGLAKLHRFYLKKTMREMERLLLSPKSQRVPIRVSQFGDQGVVRGLRYLASRA